MSKPKFLKDFLKERRKNYFLTFLSTTGRHKSL